MEFLYTILIVLASSVLMVLIIYCLLPIYTIYEFNRWVKEYQNCPPKNSLRFNDLKELIEKYQEKKIIKWHLKFCEYIDPRKRYELPEKNRSLPNEF